MLYTICRSRSGGWGRSEHVCIGTTKTKEMWKPTKSGGQSTRTL
jgi:hypothetical protein